jgi:hypothetical protein
MQRVESKREHLLEGGMLKETTRGKKVELKGNLSLFGIKLFISDMCKCNRDGLK